MQELLKSRVNKSSSFGHSASTMRFGSKFHKLLQDYMDRLSPTINYYQLSKMSGIPNSRFSDWNAGRQNPSDNDLRKLAGTQQLNLTFEELALMKHQAKYGPISQSAMKKVDGLYKIPVLGKISAGPLSLLHKMDEVTEYVDWYDINMFSSDIFALRVDGDSMWPPIPDGAVVLCRPVEQIVTNGIYVIEIENNHATLKAFRFINGSPQLTPLNPEFKPIPLDDKSISGIYEVLEYKFNLKQ